MKQIILDTETTGLSPEKGHRITEIGCLEMIDCKLTGKSFQTYLNPERSIDAQAMKITGLTNEFLADKAKFVDIVDDFLSFIQDAELIIHNAPFDLGFLNNELKLISHSIQDISKKNSVFDTLVLARSLHPGQRNSLDALCRRYKIDNSHRKYHGALLDSEILATVYLAMTSGQTSLALDHDQNKKLSSQIKNKQLKREKGALKIVKANTSELKNHEEYLEHIKKVSDGTCVWLDTK
jgi:DNA polymerase III subunit epsilon